MATEDEEQPAEEKEKSGLGQEEEKKEEGEEEEMKPWEQHSAVISIPRYDYKAPSSFLDRSLSGFLITCPIKREKSAIKEAIPLLEKFVTSLCSNGSAMLEFGRTSSGAKKRKVCSEETNAEDVQNMERNGGGNTAEISDEVAEEARLPCSEATENVKSSLNVSLVKLTRSGLLHFTFPNNNFRHVVGVLSTLLVTLESGNVKRPLWCNRIFPIQETCILKEKYLRIAVSKLVQEYMGEEQEKLEAPIKFAVGYNRRGIEDTEMKNSRFVVKDSDSKVSPLLDRDNCFKIVAGAFKDVAINSTVDLKSPEVAVLVELLPISGVSLESPVVGVSILPHELITTKPRLCVKPLVSDARQTKRRD